MRMAIIALFVGSAALLAALEKPVQSQQKKSKAGSGDESLPEGVIHVLASPAFRHVAPITGLASAKGGKQLVTSSEDGAVLWDAVTGKRLKLLVPGKVKRLA